MWIRSLECRNFRNYEYVKLEPDPGINIITGENAQGKTNLLEAIYLAGTAKSHRAGRDREMIRFGEPEAHIRLEVMRGESPYRIDIHLKRSGSKGIAVGGIPIRRTSELYGVVNVVFFSPEDLSLIKDAPAKRRTFCDMELCQLSAIYVDNLIHYNKAVMQRNALLKDIGFRKDYEAMLPAWEEQLVRYGKPLIAARREFVEELSQLVEPIHRKLTGGRETIAVTYEPNVGENEFADRLFMSGENDRRAGTTTCGPHRDDIGFTVDGIDIRHYGSQGQQRTAALSLKLAEIDLVRRRTGQTPILLLDDVLSELDASRQNHLMESISDVQTLITCTGLDEFVKNRFPTDRVFEVTAGTVAVR